MKRWVYVICVIIVAAISSGCHKSKSAAIPVGMSASINGLSWVASNCLAHIEIYSPGPLAPQKSLIIAGTFGPDTTGTYLSLVIDNYNSVSGTFNISATTNGAEYGDYSINSFNTAASGSIILTSVSATNVEGAFSFIADNFSITNGRFNAPVK